MANELWVGRPLWLQRNAAQETETHVGQSFQVVAQSMPDPAVADDKNVADFHALEIAALTQLAPQGPAQHQYGHGKKHGQQHGDTGDRISAGKVQRAAKEQA